jgi:glycosyltransferase involved in cell wall biosynthesis
VSRQRGEKVVSRRRVVYVHHAGGLGGAPLSLLLLLRCLDRRRYDPIVLALAPGPAVDRFRAEGVETRVVAGAGHFSHTELEWYGGADLWRLPFQAARFWPAVRRLRRELRALAPDLVHLNSSTLAAAAVAARRESIPVIWHVREPLAAGYLGLRRAWLARRIARDAARVIALSSFDAARLGPSARVRIVPNFVDFAEFDRRLDGTAARRHLGVPAGARVVTMLGGVSRAKGTLELVRAAGLVRRTIPDVVFLVAGRPPSLRARSPLRALARRALRVDAYDRLVLAAAEPLGASVRFVGVRADVPALLAASDVVAFPSTVPHFARPVIEAGAMARPVVASRLGGPLELVEDGVTGLLVSPGDLESLASALARLLSDPEHAARLGEAGYRRARADFEAEANARRTFAVYAEVLG